MGYEFSTALSPEEVFVAIRSKATPLRKGWRFTSDRLFYEISDESHFMMIYSGPVGAAGGQTPFFGQVKAEDGRTVIRGRFRLPAAALWVIIPFCLAVPLFLILKGALSLLLRLTPILFVWYAGLFVFFYWIAPLLFASCNKKVVDFIKSNLVEQRTSASVH